MLINPVFAGENAQNLVLRGAALVLTMDPHLGEGPLGAIDQADIFIRNGRISHIASSSERRPAGDKNQTLEIDASGMIVMPGFIDTHNHLWQTAIRSCGTDLELPGWLDDCMFKIAGHLRVMGEDAAYAFVRLSTLDLIRTGITTVLDWSIASSTEMVTGNIRALKDSGLRHVFAYFDWACTVEDCSQKEATREHITRLKHTEFDPDPLGSLQTASHPIDFFEPAIENMTSLARQLDISFNVHLHEHKDDPHGEINGIFPAQLDILERYGAINKKLIINHAIHLTESEIRMLADRGVRVTHNPLSNMRLASGIMKLPQMQDAGMKVGLGLDGGANDTSDMFSLMRAAVGLQRITHLSAAVYPGVSDVLRLATLGGAEVLGLHDITGSLTPGKAADVIVIDPHAVNFAPKGDWPSQIVFNAQPENVKYVFVAGRMLKKNGELLADVEDILIKAEKTRQKIDDNLNLPE